MNTVDAVQNEDNPPDPDTRLPNRRVPLYRRAFWDTIYIYICAL